MELAQTGSGMLRSMVDDNGLSLQVEFRQSDGKCNATLMCQSAGKEWKNYWKSKSTKAFVSALERSVPNGTNLVDSQTTGPNASRGTWVHEQIAVDLARWISPTFGVFVSGLVIRYAKGELTTEESKATASEVQASTSIRLDGDSATLSYVLQWNNERDKCRETNKAGAAAIQACGNGKRKVGAYVFISYNDGMNRAVTGRKTGVLRQELDLKKGSTPRDRMQPEQLNLIQFLEGMIGRHLTRACTDAVLEGRDVSDGLILSIIKKYQDEVYGLCVRTGAHALPLLDKKPPRTDRLLAAVQAKKPNKRQRTLLEYVAPEPPPLQIQDFGDLYD